jgi:uncharacterized protein
MSIFVAYSFQFNLTRISRSLFRDIAIFSKKKVIHKKLGSFAKLLVEKFKIYEITGLPASDAVMIVEDMVDVYIRNLSERDAFLKTKKRALLLSHCSRKHMDGRCKATFDKKMSSYTCMHCSPDCRVNMATKIGQEKGYDVYVLPGSSCIKRVLNSRKYDGVVGVACCEEIKLGRESLAAAKISSQGVPLLKNGCSGTSFNLRTLRNTL